MARSAATLPKVNTDEWRAWRRGGLGASDLPVLLGEDPWTTERELALEKRGLIERPPPSSVQQLGHDIEDVIARRYARDTGRRLARFTFPVVSRRWPYLFADPDRRVIGERRLVEIKWRHGTPRRRTEIQALAQMGLTGAEVVDIVTLDEWGRLDTRTVERNDIAIRNLLELGDAWYRRYVLGEELPPVDASRGARRHLDGLPGGDVLDARGGRYPELEALMSRLRALRHDRASIEQEEARVVNLMCAALAGHDGAEGDGWRISYRRTKDRQKVAWREIADGLLRQLPEAEREALVSIHTTTEPGSRPFIPTWSAEEVRPA